jgi:ribonuclease P protein component
MIIRAHRFHGYNALRHVYSRGQTVRGPMLAVKYLASPRRTSYRAAVVVSRKVHKSAVVRGRIRRRIYEIIRGQETYISEPYDIIVTVFSDQLATMDASSLQQEIVTQLARSGILTVSSRGESAESHAIVDTKERTS